MTENTPLIREDVQGFLALVNSLPAPERLDPVEQRAGYLGLKAMTEADPRPMAVIKDLTCPGPAGDIPVFNTVLEGLRAGHRFNTGVVYLPPSGVRDGVAELIRVNPELRKIVIITEKIAVILKEAR